MTFPSDSSFHLSRKTTILLLFFFFFPSNERLIQKNDHGNYGEVWHIQSHLVSLYFCLCSPTQRSTCKRRWTSLYVLSRATAVEKHEFWIGCISDVRYEINMSRDYVLTVMNEFWLLNNTLYCIPNLFFFFLFYLVNGDIFSLKKSSTF